ncbi:MAG: trigger factor [Rickettsiales bacterium]|nr:trigger factor [Rickettsiales bacterium]
MTLKVEKTKSKKLRHEFAITVPAAQVEEQIQQKLTSLQKTIKMPGFRPGKVPMDMVRKRHGQRVMGEVLETLVRQTSSEAVKKENLRPIMEPEINVKDFGVGKDLTYTMAVDVLPEMPEVDFGKITLKKEPQTVGENEVQDTIKQVLEGHVHYHDIKDPRAAKNQDRVIIDFTGYLNDVPFEGGASTKFPLVLGSNQFIGGFEEQVVGMKPGDSKRIKVTFPENYHKDDLAGQPAEFEVKLHEIHEPHKQTEADDHFAEHLGFKDLEALKNEVRARLEEEAKSMERMELKRQLFDALDKVYSFEVPEKMVNLEYESIWKQVQQARQANPESEEFKGKSEKELEKEYREMAARRVRLGVLLSDIGVKNNVQISGEELSKAILEQARQYPGQEQRVIEYYRQNPEEAENLRGPLLEEKVVDFIIGKVKITEAADGDKGKKNTDGDKTKAKSAEGDASSGKGKTGSAKSKKA